MSNPRDAYLDLNHFATQYKRSITRQKTVTAPTMNVSRDFRRRIAVKTLLTCNKSIARIKYQPYDTPAMY